MRLLPLFLIAILAITALVAGLDYFLLQRPLPVTEGALGVPGLQKPVEVFRDAWGVAHIYAGNLHDLLFAQGFVHAQDRLWQMEMNRRMAFGRLSEVFGQRTLEVDRAMRILGFAREAQRELENISPELLENLKAYSDGVNACIEDSRDRLPIEFRLLFLNPEPWKPIHTLAFGKFLALVGGSNWEMEVLRMRLAERVGAERARELDPVYPREHPIIFAPPSDSHKPNAHGVSLPQALRRSVYMDGASNSWAVSGGRSTSGSPLLANDMHLPLKVPCMWYEIHLSGGGYHVAGLSLPGAPLVMAGHNERIAWGITSAYSDVMDLYVEQEIPGGRHMFRNGDGTSYQAATVIEPISVRTWDEPVREEVVITRHGPVVSSIFGVEKTKLALRWSLYDGGRMLQAVERMNKAQNWEEFRFAAGLWSEPTSNFTYADVDGNVGYVLGAPIPIRKRGDGSVPVPGWTNDYEWVGYVPARERPAMLNPSSGVVFTANNKIADNTYPYLISRDQDVGYRAETIRTFLQERDKIGPEDCRVLQGHIGYPAAAELLPLLKGLRPGNALEAKALQLMRNWDGKLSEDSPEAAVVQVFEKFLLEETFSDELKETADYYFGVGLSALSAANGFLSRTPRVLREFMKDPDSPWFDSVTTPERETLTDVLRRSLSRTVDYLGEKLGDNPEDWKWGQLHRARMNHPLGAIPLLGLVLNIGDFPVGGGSISVRQASFVSVKGFDVNAWTATNRHIYDLGDFDRSLANIVPGQSGQPASPHYKDQVELWRRVDYHPLYFSRARVEAETRSRLMLESGS